MLTKRFNQIFKLIILGLLLAGMPRVTAQSITLAECQSRAMAASPLQQKSNYVASIRTLQEQNRTASSLPQLSVQGSATYQSDVFHFPLSLPGSDIPMVPKDQYNLSVQLNQQLYDGGMARANRQVEDAELSIRQTETDLSLTQVQSVISELYFGVLTVQENTLLIDALLNELDNRYNKARVSYQNGLVLASTLRLIEKEKLKAAQQKVSLAIRQEALRQALGNWVGQDLRTYQLIFPEILPPPNAINRVEIRLFDQQNELYHSKILLNQTTKRPRLSAFALAGLGQPNPMNFFETGWSDYYMIGARLQWNAWDWGKTRRNSDILAISQQSITSEKEQFLRNVQSQQFLAASEIEQLNQLLLMDQKLVALQKEILEESRIQAEQGTLSEADYISQLNEYVQVQLQLKLHQIQLSYQTIAYMILTGNL
ncbi:MAG: TolC family protein [Cyclobacteriaceae bacterium]|nr:TolC family protein [Cyclobacteriaceae bacterium]